MGVCGCVRYIHSVPLTYKLGWVVLHAYFFFLFWKFHRLNFLMRSASELIAFRVHEFTKQSNTKTALAYFMFVRP